MQKDIMLELLVPKNDVENPEFTILIPALNESLTIGEFIDWCHEGIKKAGIACEILIVDSSSDNTSEIALSRGARVLKAPKRGLGRAYIDGVPFARGKYLIFGDCDLTYDFRELVPFVEAFRGGADYIMGSRFKGYIEKGAMPFLHQYFGTPVTTWILNRLYGTKFSDIHCGMRGITKDAFIKMDMKSQSWEYASEMVLKAAKLKLNIKEVPIRFYKDRDGRLSHHKRAGWTSSWKAGWINLKAMLLYAPDFFFLKPGILLAMLGFLFTLLIIFRILPDNFNWHYLMLGITATVLGVSSAGVGLIGKVYNGFEKGLIDKLNKYFSYDKGMLYAAIQICAGALLLLPIVFAYIFSGLRLLSNHREAFLGLLLLMTGFQTVALTLILTLILKDKTK